MCVVGLGDGGKEMKKYIYLRSNEVFFWEGTRVFKTFLFGYNYYNFSYIYYICSWWIKKKKEKKVCDGFEENFDSGLKGTNNTENLLR